jgi:hypothetical protein
MGGRFGSLYFWLKYRERRAAEALHKAEAERHLLEKQSIETELKLMQEQVEPIYCLFTQTAGVNTDRDRPTAGTRHRTTSLTTAETPQWRKERTTHRKGDRFIDQR